jgi:hypothetical protein
MRRSRLLLLLPTGLALALPGCFFSRRAADVEKTPTVDTGMGAAIIMPGETAPMNPHSGGNVNPGGTNQSRSGPGGESVSRSGGPGQPSTGNLSMIGGSGMDKERHDTGQEDPLIFKWITAPFAALAAPFVYAAEKARGEPEPGPPVPKAAPQRPEAERRPPPSDYETQQLEAMERELERHAPQPPDPLQPQPRSKPQAGAAPTLSIADELATLQRTPRTPEPTRARVERPAETKIDTPPEQPLTSEAQLADGIVDRDGDGRVDLWIYRREGEIVRKALDQNFDGRPDTTLHYDAATHELALVEEDTDHDGVTEAWTTYRNGKLVRRRTDANGDGQADSWTYYRDGEITRHEQDTSGDGFRDRTGHYEAGRLVREEHDRDSDGRPDVTSHYDVKERVSRREEDTDRDGDVDVITHYENGRLARKELLGDAGSATP